jgi:hypothetical protein
MVKFVMPGTRVRLCRPGARFPGEETNPSRHGPFREFCKTPAKIAPPADGTSPRATLRVGRSLPAHRSSDAATRRPFLVGVHRVLKAAARVMPEADDWDSPSNVG